MDFGFDWILNDPNAQKLRVTTPNGEVGYLFGAQDFIDYLNEFIFPDQKSELIAEMDFYDYKFQRSIRIFRGLIFKKQYNISKE